MKLAVLIFLALLLPVPAFAGQLEDAEAAINRSDWPAAVKLLQPLADQGDGEAQMYMGDMYMSGHALKKDPGEAMKWYRKSADQGNAAGELNVGGAYKRGAGVPKDSAEGMKWILKAADQGYAPAQLALSGIYTRGDGVKQDKQEGYFHFLLYAKTVPDGNADVAAQVSMFDKFYAEVLTPEQIAAAKKRAAEWKPVPAAPVPAAAAKP